MGYSLRAHTLSSLLPLMDKGSREVETHSRRSDHLHLQWIHSHFWPRMLGRVLGQGSYSL